MRDSPQRFLFSRWTWLWLAIAGIVLLLAGWYAFVNAGVWLVREDPLTQAQIVVVLSGGLPDRALAAAQVFQATQARQVWLTSPRQPGAAMRQLDLPYSGEEEYSRMVLIAKGVPPASIRILQPQINNTADELWAVYDQLRSQPPAAAPVTVVVVTSKAHTRRVRVIWRVIALGANDPHFLVRAAPQDSFDAEHWWRTTNDALSVVREYLGLLNAWAGLPVHHTT